MYTLIDIPVWQQRHALWHHLHWSVHWDWEFHVYAKILIVLTCCALTSWSGLGSAIVGFLLINKTSLDDVLQGCS